MDKQETCMPIVISLSMIDHYSCIRSEKHHIHRDSEPSAPDNLDCVMYKYVLSNYRNEKLITIDSKISLQIKLGEVFELKKLDYKVGEFCGHEYRGKKCPISCSLSSSSTGKFIFKKKRCDY